MLLESCRLVLARHCVFHSVVDGKLYGFSFNLRKYMALGIICVTNIFFKK